MLPVTADAGEPPRCPVCDATCVPLGAVEFNKCCEELRGTRLPTSGRLIEYVICPGCDFSFAPEFQAWTLTDFEREIYNEDYVRVDPDAADVRPRMYANSLIAAFGEQGRAITHLDYGGGAGLLSELLRQAGWQSTSWDPFFDRGVDPKKLGTFQLITCFEVFEHVPDAGQLAKTLASLLATDGLLMFSTQVSDGQLATGQPLTWWYASPRNGHISLFSMKSLGGLAQRHGLKFASNSPGTHVFFRTRFPAWARPLLQGG